jgi:hypothetical protein
VKARLLRHNEEATPRISTPAAARLIRLALWTFVAIGALGGIAGALRPTPTVVQRAADQTDLPPAGISGIAELAVRDWLNTSGRTLTSRAADGVVVDSVTTVAVRSLASDYWAVTVAAVAHGDAKSTWYLEVGIAEGATGPRPVGSPAFVPPPVTLTPTDAAGPSPAIPKPGDPVAATTGAFLRALLAGVGDPVRYVAPNAGIPPMNAAPFNDVRLDRLAFLERAERTARVRAAITATTAGLEFDVIYEIALRERDGRWEVTAITGAPSRRRDTSAPSSTTTSTSTPAATPGA